MITSLTPSTANPTRSRRTMLAEAVRTEDRQWTADRVARTNAAGNRGPNRNTARKDLRALARDGVIVTVPRTGAHTYVLADGDGHV